MFCDDLEGGDGVWERGERERGGIHLADSLHCTAGINTMQYCKATIPQLKNTLQICRETHIDHFN